MSAEGPPITIENPSDDDDDELFGEKKSSTDSVKRSGNFLSRMLKEKEQVPETKEQQSERFAGGFKNVFPNLVGREQNTNEISEGSNDHEQVDTVPSAVHDEAHEYPLDTSISTEIEAPELPESYPQEFAPDTPTEKAPDAPPPLLVEPWSESKPAEPRTVDTPSEMPKPALETPTDDSSETGSDTELPEATPEEPATPEGGEPPETAEGEPPAPPPPPVETTPDFGAIPPVPPNGGGNNGGRFNFNTAAPMPSPRIERVPTPVTRERWGPVALVAAVAVDLMSRRRDRRIRREQAKKNRQLEKMIKERPAKQTGNEAGRNQARQSTVEVIAQQPTIITKEQASSVAKEPEVINIVQQQREKLQAVPAQANNAERRSDRLPTPVLVPEMRTISEARPSAPLHERAQAAIKESERTITQEVHSRHTEQLTEKQRKLEKEVERLREQESEKLTETLSEKQVVKELVEKEIEDKKKQKLPETVFDQRHEIKDDRSGDLPAETLGSQSGKQSSDSQPVTHIAAVLAEKQRAAQAEEAAASSYTQNTGLAKDLNKQYAKTGFIAAIIIVIGVALIFALR